MHVLVIVYQDVFLVVVVVVVDGGLSSQPGEELPHDKQSPLN